MEEGATAMPELLVTEEDDELEETIVNREPLVVRPKHKEKHEEEKTESQEAQGPNGTQTSSGHWWHSSALTGKMGHNCPLHLLPGLGFRAGGRGSGPKTKKENGATPLAPE